LSDSLESSENKKRACLQDVKDVVVAFLKHWSLVSGVSRRPEIDGTAIVHFVSPM
jgi:hypothetical protein